MVLIVLVLTVCVASLCGGLALLGHTERRIAHAHLRAVQTAYAASAAANLAIDAVARQPLSTLWPSAGTVSALGPSAPVMAIWPGETIDLVARTVEWTPKPLAAGRSGPIHLAGGWSPGAGCPSYQPRPCASLSGLPTMSWTGMEYPAQTSTECL